MRLFNREEWAEEINGLRNYLISKNLVFNRNARLRLRQLVLEDDFEMACKLYEWLCRAEGRLLTHLLVDAVLSKVKAFALKHMEEAWSKRFVTVELYNLFISKYWSTLSQMLQCPEDDHDVTNEIYRCFEEEFIRIRTQQAFKIFVTGYPESEPTLLELRSVLKTPAKYTQLVTELLSQFEARMLNPSITTAEILLSYVKAIKSILTIDVSFRYFQLLTDFVRPFLMERRDTVVTFLYAMLGLDASETRGPKPTGAHASIASQLSAELKDSHQPIFRSALDKSAQSPVDDMASVNPKEPVYQQVINFYLHWTPEPSDSIQANNSDTLMNKGLFDIIVELFDSKDIIIGEFLTLFTDKLLDLKGYRLEQNWVKSLKILKNRFDFKNYSNAQGVSNINNIDVMLRDVKHSEELCAQMHSVPEISREVIPMFISYLFWNAGSKFSTLPKDCRLPSQLESEIRKYKDMYAQIKPGRKLRLHQEQSTVVLQLHFADKRVMDFEVSMDKSSVLACVAETTGISRDKIVEATGLEKAQVDQNLRFWLDASVLRFDSKTSLYSSLERQDTDNASEREAQMRAEDQARSAFDSQQQQFVESMEKVWPFIRGMLTNLGTLKVEKIHSFLKVAVPKEIGFNATTAQLEAYLRLLVDENKLVCSANNAFKLVKEPR